MRDTQIDNNEGQETGGVLELDSTSGHLVHDENYKFYPIKKQNSFETSSLALLMNTVEKNKFIKNHSPLSMTQSVNIPL